MEYVFYGNRINPLPRRLFSLYYEIATRQRLNFIYDSSGVYVIKGKTIHNYDCRLSFEETENGYSVSINEFTVHTKKYKYMLNTFEKVKEFYKRNPKYNVPIFQTSSKTPDQLFKDCFPMVIFDTERSDSEIIQFGGQLLDYVNDQFEIIDEMNIYIQLPKGKYFIRRKVSEMTKIDKKFLKEYGIPPGDAAELIAEFIKRAKTVCGQSVFEDVRCLNVMLNKNQVKIPKCLNNLIDIAILYQYLNDSSNLLALEKEAAGYNLKINEDNLHNAYFDALLTKEVMEKVMPEFIRKFNTSPILKIYQLEGKNRVEDLKTLRFTKER